MTLPLILFHNQGRGRPVGGGDAGIAWLLNDSFDDTLTAGNVHGTAAVPGPGTRVVVDTASTLSISSGECSLTGKSVSGDPSYWSDVLITRTAGILLVAKSTRDGDGLAIGFDSGKTGAIVMHTFLVSGGGLLRAKVNLLWQPELAILSENAYWHCVVMRATGCYFFIKSATQFPNWTLVWMGNAGSGNVYAGFQQTNVETPAIDFLRVPEETWLPTPLAYDTFTRSNGAIGTSEAAGPDSQAVAAKTWTGATWTITTNTAINTPTLGAELATGNLVVGNWYSITASQADHFYVGSAIGDTFKAAATTGLDANNKVKLITLATLFASLSAGSQNVVADVELRDFTAATQYGMVLCLDDATTPANFLVAYHDGTNATLLKCVAGTYTSVITAAAVYAANATMRVVKDGTSVSLFYNNLKIGTTQTVSDAGIINNTLHGLFSTYASNILDNFSVFPRGNGGEYSKLDKWIK